jgi:hypothetical protein
MFLIVILLTFIGKTIATNATNCTGAFIFNLQNENLFFYPWDELFNKSEWVFVHFWLILIYQTFAWRNVNSSFKAIVFWEFIEWLLSMASQFCVFYYGSRCPSIISIDWFGESLVNKVGDLIQGYLAIRAGAYFLSISGFTKKDGWNKRTRYQKLRRTLELISLSLFQTSTMVYYHINTCLPIFPTNMWDAFTTKSNMFAIGFLLCVFGSTIIVFIMKVEDDVLFPENQKKNSLLFGFIIIYLLLTSVALLPYVFSAYIITWGVFLFIYIFINTIFADLIANRDYEYREDYISVLFW